MSCLDLHRVESAKQPAQLPGRQRAHQRNVRSGGTLDPGKAHAKRLAEEVLLLPEREDREREVYREEIVNSDDRHSTRSENATDLADRGTHVRRTHDHSERIHDVERRTFVGQAFRVGPRESRAQPGELEAPTRQLEVTRHQIDGRDVSACGGKLLEVRPHPAPDLEDLRSCEPVRPERA